MGFMDNLGKILTRYINNNEIILGVTASNPRDREKIQKLRIRPVRKKEELIYQAECYVGTKAYHRNLSKEELPSVLVRAMAEDFRQLELESERHRLTVLVSKKGKVTIKEKEKNADGLPGLNGLFLKIFFLLAIASIVFGVLLSVFSQNVFGGNIKPEEYLVLKN